MNISRPRSLALAICLIPLGLLALGLAFIQPAQATNAQHAPDPLNPTGVITATFVGRYTRLIPASEDFFGAAEIVDHDPTTHRLFVVNALSSTIDILDGSDPANITLLDAIDVTPYGHSANSVAVNNGYVAAAIQADPAQDPGTVAFFDTDGNFVAAVTVGALPDMVTFSPDGQKVLVANEGEPDSDYLVDPEGSVSIIDVAGGIPNVTQNDVTQVTFTAFNGAALDPSVRIFGPNATVAQDVEPEYIAVSADSSTAWVTLQENNAVAVIDINAGMVTGIVGLGFKDHALAENPLDASNEDGPGGEGAINIANWPVYGMYLPDSIATYEAGGSVYLVTANEGDSRDYDGFSEEERVKDLTLDPTAFPFSDTLQLDENLGRLKVTNTLGDTDSDGDYDELYAFGARSFTIWDTNGNLVWDSADALEQITAQLFPNGFNSDGENDTFDSRSDDKGPEPEGLAIGKVYGRTFAFVGLERIGGFFIYDISNPMNPAFVQYVTTRDFSGDLFAGTSGDISPEGLKFVPAAESPTGKPLLLAAHELSNTTAVFEITALAPTDVSLTGLAGDGHGWGSPLGLALLLLVVLAGGLAGWRRLHPAG